MYSIMKNHFSKEAEMPIYFLALYDKRQGGVESNDKV